LTLSASPAGLCLTVGDDGVGLPPGLDFRQAPSLGLKLVNALVEQLRGHLELDTDGKTEFRITFPIQEIVT
jgi:two-component sensor histidine kinase